METYINGISYYLPTKKLDNVDLSNMYPEWSVEKISEKTGIYSRHISDEEEFSSDMAVKAIENLINECDIDKSNIDYLILCTQSPDYQLPSTACIIQDRSELPKNCGAIDINMGCSGYIYGLGLAKGLISSGQANNIVFVTSETYTKFIHPEDRSNRTIFGDGAAATLITSKPDFNRFTAAIGNFEYGTDGSGYNQLIVKNSGIKFKNIEYPNVYDDDGKFISNDNCLYMNGKEIFNFTAFKVPPLIDNTLKLNSLTINDTSMFIFHQANAYMLNFVRKRCKIPESKFYISINDVGNTVSSTIPIALKRYINEIQPKKNDKILLAGFGVGLSLGAVVIECV